MSNEPDTAADTAERWRQNRNAVDLLAVAVAFALVAIQFAAWLAVGPLAGRTSKWTLGIGIVLLVVAVSYATHYWGPPLYLLSAVLVGTFTVFWAFREGPLLLAGARLVLAVALFGLLVYLFYRDRAYLAMIGKESDGGA